ncbi:histidine--tRNA ligase [Desulfurivibrio dismutans]|uniref:histidine--tRNA ligase n=1 Tax=Desulfurivibrio dismutans TaxID=1398908 RepID=UPI0023DA6434|nr:histidine--tRNA ligase [Desulfurivibrio alkaliphilus]MDF1613936.1 histidine--tRNA ligase [Desulfurivibrio alkaliphilus]
MQALKGFKDILPDEARLWQRVEGTARDIFRRFGFEEIKVPILEKTGLFARSIGEATDIVEKEMYTFSDRNGESITMRPEGTAPVLRAFIEHALHLRRPINRLFTVGPMFRHERPQKGRLRQFHQLSVEALGADHPRLDAEVIAMARQLLVELGLKAELQLNSLGCPDCRPAYRAKLVEFLSGHREQLCEDCRRRVESNPLRVLDCKSANCRRLNAEAPAILGSLCAPCDQHLARVRQDLDALQIPYTMNPFMVRGLDYYTRTTFELLTDALGAQSAVGAGGRYDGLVKQLGGPDLPGIGFAMGLERLVLLLQEQEQAAAAGPDLFLACLGEPAAAYGFTLLQKCRLAGLSALMDIQGRGLKSQMKQADRLHARHVLIIGEDELNAGQAVLRNLDSKEERQVALDDELTALLPLLQS